MLEAQERSQGPWVGGLGTGHGLGLVCRGIGPGGTMMMENVGFLQPEGKLVRPQGLACGGLCARESQLPSIIGS